MTLYVGFLTLRPEFNDSDATTVDAIDCLVLGKTGGVTVHQES